MHSTEARVYTAVLTGVFVLLIIIAFFVVTIIRYQRKKTSLHRERICAEINSLENERLRIAKDLHDDLGSTLSAIKLKLHSIEPGNHENVSLAEQSGNYIDEAMVKLRNISMNITPQILQRRGLAAALGELLQMTLSSTGINVNASCDIHLQDKDTGIHIYRIVQEIITNIVRHADAANVMIHLAMPDSRYIFLHIQDDGKGFSKRAVLNNNCGQGLQNIMSRVDILNARMYLTTEPGKGTDYLIKIPAKND